MNIKNLTEQDDAPQGENLPQTSMTFGEILVGLDFNPSNDNKVHKAKRLCADLADLLYDELKTRESCEISHILYSTTIGKILDAQMNVVKLITLKY